jgi:hypothetical protein
MKEQHSFGQTILGTAQHNAAHAHEHHHHVKSHRDEALEHQHDKCALCKRPLEMDKIHFDHLKHANDPYAADIHALCASCHAHKTRGERVHDKELKKAHERKVKNPFDDNFF